MQNNVSKTIPDCAGCGVPPRDRLCKKEGGKAPLGCPTIACGETIASALSTMMDQPALFEFAKKASIQEGEGYGNKDLGYERLIPIKTRLAETIEFAGKMGYKRLGLAFCMGLRAEAKAVSKLVTGAGFELVSAVCKVGRVPKETLGITEEQKIEIGCFEAMCNPVAQAAILNDEKTEFNIVIGLCVGHDSLFLQHSAAPCTVLAVKDRMLGHNPLAAIYTLNTYHRAQKGLGEDQ